MLKQISKKGSKLKSKVRYKDQSQSLKLEGHLKRKANNSISKLQYYSKSKPNMQLDRTR